MYIIIGQGAAANAAAHKIKQLRPTVPVLMISKEPHSFYSRIDLPGFIAGTFTAEQTQLRSLQHYAELGIKCLMGTCVERIAPAQKSVFLSSGEQLNYEKLLLASGSQPLHLPLENAGTRGVHSLWTLDDATAIRESAMQARHAVVAGSGLIGLKSALALQSLGLEVSVVEAENRIMPRQLDVKASNMLAGQLEKRGIHLLPATRLEGIHTEKGRVSAVSLQGGRSLPCELLLAAVGVRPDTRLAQEAGLTVQRGIVVDSYLQSSDPFIYAAGDVVESPDALSGQSIVFATWPNAVEQGRLAAANMLGLRQAISPCVTMNSVELAGVPLISFGDILGGPQDTIWTQEKSGVYHKLVLRNDVLRGALCFGDVCRAGVLGTMVLRQSSVVGMDLRAPHFNYAQLLTL